jgi:hypothetical protein
MVIERYPDWETRLGDYIAVHQDTAFEWGGNDCALFAGGGVAAITGFDATAPFRGRYSTKAGAARALIRYGAGTVEATFDIHLPEVPPSFARRGDVVMVAREAGDAVGICLGADAVFVGEEDGAPGLVRIARREWSKAWKVG